MNKSFNSAGLQFVWDSTSITVAEECLRKYYYWMLRGLRTKEDNVHLRFGGHYATALEHFHKHRAEGKSLDEALLLIVKEAMIATWDYDWEECTEAEARADLTTFGSVMTKEVNGKLHRTVGEGHPWESGHNLKNRETLIRTIVWYVEQFRGDACKTLHLRDGRPAVELSFTLEVDDGIMFAGHMDRVVEYSGDKYIQDQKTTGSTLSPRYFDQYSPDIQMSMYTFAGKAVFDIPVSGVIIDAVQIAVGFSKFERGFTFRTQAQLTEWYESTMATIARTQRATAEGVFPMNRTACTKFSGCQFRKLCSLSPDVREHFVKSEFTSGVVWDPLERR